MPRFAMIGLTLLGSMTVVAIAAPPVPATRPTATRPATRAMSNAPASRPARVEQVLGPAITTLTREATTAFQKREPLPRTESNFFANSPPAVAQADLLKLLDGRLNTDPRIDAYVKWQLLSAVDKFDAGVTKQALGAYVDASPMIPLPGMSEGDRERWNNLAAAVTTRDASDQLTKRWENELQPYVDANAGIITYRDAIRAKITPATDVDHARVLQAETEDLSQRAAAGLETEKAFTQLAGELRAWATINKRGAIADMVNFLREYARRDGATINDKLVFYSNRNRASWRTRKAQLDANKLSNLISSLETTAQQAPQ